MAAFDVFRVNRSRRLAGLLAALLSLPLAGGAAAQAAGGAAPAGGVEVRIVSPVKNEPVFGVIEVLVEVKADEELAEVALEVDEQKRMRLTEPPWRFRVDLGEENREHSFKVVARTLEGKAGEAAMRTAAIHVDEELDVELQQLYVTVTQNDKRVLDLQQDDFTIRDNGVQQQIVTFARGDVPITAAVLVDSSESMKGERLDAALRGSKAFVDGMRELDEAMLMLFSDRLLRSTPFTDKSSELLAALDGVTPGGNTSVNDHLYLALKLLEARQGRRVIVLFTDGADLHSVLDMDDVIWKARRSQVLIYWIVLLDRGAANTSYITAWRGKDDNARQLQGLARITEQTGARVIGIPKIDDTEKAFREILAELREQYVLGFYPSSSLDDGKWHEVKVNASRSGVDVRAREGYVDQ
jgi:Ca-activated chloride channel family protein